MLQELKCSAHSTDQCTLMANFWNTCLPLNFRRVENYQQASADDQGMVHLLRCKERFVLNRKTVPTNSARRENNVYNVLISMYKRKMRKYNRLNSVNRAFTPVNCISLRKSISSYQSDFLKFICLPHIKKHKLFLTPIRRKSIL